jgi:hypothetical protein
MVGLMAKAALSIDAFQLERPVKARVSAGRETRSQKAG